jgi:hypothetical protein
LSTLSELGAAVGIRVSLLAPSLTQGLFGMSRIAATALVARRTLQPAHEKRAAAISAISDGQSGNAFEVLEQAQRNVVLGYSLLGAGFKAIQWGQTHTDLILGAAAAAQALKAITPRVARNVSPLVDALETLREELDKFVPASPAHAEALKRYVQNAKSVLEEVRFVDDGAADFYVTFGQYAKDLADEYLNLTGKVVELLSRPGLR